MLQIRLLGGFDITYNDRPVSGLHQARLQLLLACLLLQADRPISRQQLASQFWPDSTEKQARTNLRKLLHSLRQLLPNADDRLMVNTHSIQWQMQAHDAAVDVHDFEAALVHGQQSTRSADIIAGLASAVSVYAGDLLPGQYDEWLTTQRARLRSLYADALTDLVTLHEHQGDYATALAYAEQLLHHDPIQESTHRLIMQLHLHNENRAAALRVYHTCAIMLREELGVDPSPATEEIYQRLLHLEERTAVLAATPADAGMLPLVGRSTELRQLQRVWRHAQRGHAHLVLIQGEAGIGKTRLAEELRDVAHHQGVVTLYTRAFAGERDAAYAPLPELLRNPPVRRTFTALDDVWLTELARLLPELLAERTSLPAPAPLKESWQQRRFHESIVRAALAAGEPLLIHFDDLQWCDDETLGWLRFLLRIQPRARLLVVGTVRTEELDAGHPLQELRLELQRRGASSDIELGPMAPAEIGELAAAVAGHELAATTVTQLQIEAEGSPLFAVEIMRAYADGESLLTRPRQTGVVLDASNLPPKVQAVIQARLAQLSQPARELVAMAAIVGRQFTYDLLAEISEFGDDELVTRLDELWRRRIVRAQGVDAYDFSHDRIRDTAYLAVSPMVRRRLHEKTAHGLEAIHAQHLDEVSGRVAEHYAAAGRAADAARYFLRAGDFATAQFARNEALRYYNRALELNPSMDRNDCWRAHLGRLAIYEATGNAEAQGQQLRLLDELVSYWSRDGLSGTKLAHHQATIHIHRQTFAAQRGEQDASETHGRCAVEAATLASDHVLEAQAYLAWGDAVWRTSDFKAALARFETALEKAEAANAPALKAEALELLSQTGMFSGASHAQMMAQMRSALINYDAAGDLLGRCRILNKLGYVTVAQGMDDYEESMAHYQAALALCRQIGRKYLESTILRNIGILFCCTGRYAQAFTSLRQSLTVAKRGEHEFHRTVAINYLGYVHYQSGNLNAAAKAQLTALRSLRTQENHHFVIKTLTNLGQIYHAREENRRALDTLREARRLSAELGERRQESYAATAMGHLLLQQANVNEAADAYRFALAQHDKLEQANRALEPSAGLADVALQQGDLAVAQSQVETILEHLQTHRLDLTDEALRVYMTCRRVMVAAGDPRAERLLQQAVEQLRTRAASLETDAQREHFWSSPLHREVAQSARINPAM